MSKTKTYKVRGHKLKPRVIFNCPDKIKDDELKVLVDQQVDALLKTF